MRNRLLLAAAVAALLALPIVHRARAAEAIVQPSGWRELATEHDRDRLRGWRAAWVEALRAAREEHRAEMAREGVLLDPDAALDRPAPPPGTYMCRTIKIGGQNPALLDWVSYPQFRCRIRQDGRQLTFTRQGGSQRPVGRLYDDGIRRMIFLGSLQLGDERETLRYGADPERDLAGILERVGDNRWRLVFPRPTFESILDVIELVPAP
jgi:hypothetical protein